MIEISVGDYDVKTALRAISEAEVTFDTTVFDEDAVGLLTDMVKLADHESRAVVNRCLPVKELMRLATVGMGYFAKSPTLPITKGENGFIAYSGVEFAGGERRSMVVLAMPDPEALHQYILAHFVVGVDGSLVLMSIFNADTSRGMHRLVQTHIAQDHHYVLAHMVMAAFYSTAALLAADAPAPQHAN